MGHLSAGYACHHCDAPAPTGAGGLFVYLTSPDSGRGELQPSCYQHATHTQHPSGNVVPLHASYPLQQSA